jgi:hypothetical protein
MLMEDAKRVAEKPYYKPTLLMTKTSPCARSTLDVGCGENPYFFHKRLVNYVGIDINLAS